MVKIFLSFLFFLPLLCGAQSYIGSSKTDVEAYLKKANQKYDLSPTPLKEKFIQYKEQDGSVVKLFLENDTVTYYKVFISVYNQGKEKFEGYITTVQKIK